MPGNEETDKFQPKIGLPSIDPKSYNCDSVRHLFSQIVNPEGINIISGNIGGY